MAAVGGSAATPPRRGGAGRHRGMAALRGRRASTVAAATAAAATAEPGPGVAAPATPPATVGSPAAGAPPGARADVPRTGWCALPHRGGVGGVPAEELSTGVAFACFSAAVAAGGLLPFGMWAHHGWWDPRALCEAYV